MTGTVAEPDATEIADLLELACTVARAAGRLTLDMRASARRDPDTKSSADDLVTAADRASEELIVRQILAARPDDGFLGEEGADRAGTSGVRWVIDPIDGTSNYVYDLPGYTISIAAEVEDEQGSTSTILGVVHDPKADELFRAARGAGGVLDRADGSTQPLACSTQDDLARCIAGIGFGYQSDQRAEQGRILAAMVPQLANIRRLGSAALDLAYVGVGRLDLYWESGLNHWDSAAGALIAAESGAIVSDAHGNRNSQAMTVAAPPALHRTLLAALERASS